MNRKLLIILAIAAVLRVAAIDQPLWYDEAYTAMLVKLPLRDMLTATINDVHPPTWYLVERASSALFGYSEVALRLPAALLGLLSVYLAWRMAKNLIGENAALVTAGLMAATPFEVYYSNEARMYALLTVSVLLAIIGALERRAWLLATGTALTLLSHNMAVIYIPVIALIALWRFGLQESVISMGVGSVAWAAWLPTLFAQARQIGPGSGGYWISDITGNLFASLVAHLNQMWFPSFTPDWMIPPVVLISSALIVFPLVEAIRLRNRSALTLAALAFGPALISLCISLAWQPMILSRTLAGSLPMWLALVAWWVTLPRRWDTPRMVLIGIACTAVMATLWGYYHAYDRSTGIKAAAAWLDANANPDDIVCHADNSSIVLLSYYYHGQTAILDLSGNLRISLSEDTLRASRLRLVTPDECSWMLYVKSPLLADDVMPSVDAILRDRHAKVAYSVYKSPGTSADIFRLK